MSLHPFRRVYTYLNAFDAGEEILNQLDSFDTESPALMVPEKVDMLEMLIKWVNYRKTFILYIKELRMSLGHFTLAVSKIFCFYEHSGQKWWCLAHFFLYLFFHSLQEVRCNKPFVDGVEKFRVFLWRTVKRFREKYLHFKRVRYHVPWVQGVCVEVFA